MTRAADKERHLYIRPRLLRRIPLAVYLGVSPAKVDTMVKAGKLPKPKVVDAGVRAWDIVEVDLHIDNLPTDGEELKEEDTWADMGRAS